MQPDLASARETYGWYLVAAGQVDEGIAESRRAVELDPLSSETNTWLGINLYLIRRYDEAVTQLRAAINTDPDHGYARLFFGRVYARMARFSEAITELRTAVQLGVGPEAEAALGRAYADAGDRSKATEVLNQLREQMRATFVFRRLPGDGAHRAWSDRRGFRGAGGGGRPTPSSIRCAPTRASRRC